MPRRRHIDNKEGTNKVNILLSYLDKRLKAYVKFTDGNAYNQDKILKVVQYALWLVSGFYRKSSLEKLSEEVLWARYINRFFGLPASVSAAQTGCYGSPKALGKAMAWMLIGYYPCEHLAYLKWKAPGFCRSADSRLAAKSSAWSCRFWLAYIVLDVRRSTLFLKSKDEKDEEKSRSERLQLMRNFLFLLPAINWSLPHWDTKPLISPIVCNSLMLSEALVCLYQGLS